MNPSLRLIVAAALRPPIRDRRFWVVQGLVVLIAILHEVVDFTPFFRGVEAADVAPVAFFLIPIVYSALSFGITGSFATAVWVTLVTVPDIIAGPQLGWAGDTLQLVIVDAVAFAVGTFVERERVAREAAAAAATALARAADQYQGLFESSPAPTLVVDAAGTVHEANPAAHRLLGRTEGPLSALLGVQAAAGLLEDGERDPVTVTGVDGREHTLRPLSTPAHGPGGEPLRQVVLQDVTEETHGQRRARSYAARVIQAQEEERRRIALEIHDEPVQELIHLCRLLDGIAAGDQVGAPGRQTLEQARGVAADTVDNLRRLARSLRPPALEDLGLVAALRSFVRAFGERTGIAAEFRAPGDLGRLDRTTELALFRIAQEALHNVERHADARTAAVTLEPGETIRLEVRDDGRGFDPGTAGASTNGSLGLLGIQERASAVGGSVEVVSSPGSGTAVTVRVPARPPNPSGQA